MTVEEVTEEGEGCANRMKERGCGEDRNQETCSSTCCQRMATKPCITTRAVFKAVLGR